MSGRLCVDCLNSTSSICHFHTREDKDIVWATTTSTFTERRYTKKEVEYEIIRYAQYLVDCKWYQISDKEYYKNEIRRWLKTLKKFK